MAIKILSYDSSPNVKYVTTCTCGCKFTFNETDTWIDRLPSHIDGHLSGHCVLCPNCKNPVYGSLWYVLDPLAEMEKMEEKEE